MIKKNVLKEFTDSFVGPDEMFQKLLQEYEEVQKKDPEFENAMFELGETIVKFEDVKNEGIPPDTSAEDKKVIDNSNYSFILFTILRNMEHSGFIKIIKGPERAALKSWKSYELRKSPAKEKK